MRSRLPHPRAPGRFRRSPNSEHLPPVRAANPLAEELASLVSSRFLERITYDRLTHLPRYLKALLIRAERAALNPAKDQERLRQLAPYQDALKKLQAQPARSPEAQRQLEAFRWMVEEFKVSLFAQEVGTAMPVSPKRLDQQLEIVRAHGVARRVGTATGVRQGSADAGRPRAMGSTILLRLAGRELLTRHFPTLQMLARSAPFYYSLSGWVALSVRTSSPRETRRGDYCPS